LIDDILARVLEKFREESSIRFGRINFLPVLRHVNVLSTDGFSHINTQLLIGFLNFALINHLYAHNNLRNFASIKKCRKSPEIRSILFRERVQLRPFNTFKHAFLAIVIRYLILIQLLQPPHRGQHLLALPKLEQQPSVNIKKTVVQACL
tara:strand:- start:169 stop:618 length:450 start_codon:yes stop_codon:yes gene_type:complete